MIISEKAFESFRTEVIAGFSNMQKSVDSLDARMNETNSRLDSIRSDVGHLHHNVYKLENKVDSLSKDIVEFISY